MLSAEDNAVLTQTGASTPMGRYFRRFWQPVALSRELPEPDGAPIKLQVMGEELVAFRDTLGRVGLVDAWCPHRAAHMYYGRNEECGLRCVYHGWKFDVTGKAVDLPNVPPGVRMHDEMRIKAYPTREFGDLVWAYMGPQSDRIPELPQLEFALLPAEHRFVSKRYNECNWAQTLEGGLDTSHFSFLHMPAPGVPSNENPDAPADERRLRWIRNDPMPKFSILPHEVGFVVGGARAADDDQTYWRITQYLLPAHGTGPSTLPGETYFGYTLVPIDDVSHWMYTYAWNPERPLGEAERRRIEAGHGIVAAVDADFRGLRNKANDYLIDREAQKQHSYTGVRGLAEQDAMIQESQGPIADRTRERLTATDAAVVRMRKVVLAGAKALAAGDEPTAPWQHEAYNARPGSWMAAQGMSFEDVMVERFGDRLGRNT
ncbi:MAG: Rieske 2Fe-2S domain-containing protein [Gammaproteobacteria bacterium]|nr:Rieske 2Fe-2S domain-containing protein [Gammaproteobacteria bacterium]